MTAIEAITRTDRMSPNQIADPEKLRWLSVLDGRVRRELWDTHYDSESASRQNESETGTILDPTAELLIPHPWDETYLYWLAAMIDHTLGEIGRYNENIALFHSYYGAYADHYHRTHLPRGGAFRY